MNYDNLKTQAQSLLNRVEAALDHDQPETFAFTIGVQIGAFRSRVRRELNSLVDKSKDERALLENLDNLCFYVETEMLQAMALTREHSMMLDHLHNVRQAATTMNVAISSRNHDSIGTFWTVGEGKGEKGQRDMVHVTRVIDGKLYGHKEIDKRGTVEWDQDGKCLTWNDSRWNLGERIR